ncbi:MAG: ComF family protein [Gammaproteobacteria bacterium]
MIYPWVCCVCGSHNKGHSGICNSCISHLPWCLNENLCVVCALPISVARNTNKICGECQKSPPNYDQIHANFWYQSPIDKLISRYKYLNQWENAHTLIELSVNAFTEISKSGLVIPMPSHPARVRERGFNAVFELLKLFNKRIKFDYALDRVFRSKYTETQTGKLKSQRRKNVKGAFTVVKPFNRDHVIIFDEVVTTGATVNELSRCLKKAGVKRVTVWAIARTK